MTAPIPVARSVRWSAIVALATIVVGLPAQEWRNTTLTPRRAGFSFDPARGCTVLYGGGGLDDTWERHSGAWVQRSPAHTAGEFFMPGSMIYDTARARHVLFGTAGPGSLDGAAEYDGFDWVSVSPPVAPPARGFGAFAFDSVRNCTVLFGGGIDNPRQMLNDTWEYGINGWTQRAPTASPPGRWMHSLAFDTSRARCVMFGGHDGAPRGDTWEYDGSTWVQVAVTHAPSPRFSHTTVTDTNRGRVVLFGGYAATPQNDTWEYDGIDWQPIATVGAPPARHDHQACFDSWRNRTVVFGGFTAQGMLADTWEYDGLHWIQVADQAPALRAATALVYDAARERTVMFGGIVNGFVVADTWEHAGDGWQQRNLPVQPPARAYAMAAYDHARARTVLFGGVDLAMGWNDTWEFDGAGWTPATTPHAPSARNGGMIAYDRARRRVVLFGGTQPALLNDTWEYDGLDWQAVATAHAPSPRCMGGMAYHVELGRCVLFGGWAPPTMHGDTWEYDGTDWTQRQVAGPSARRQFAMTYDPIAGQVLLHGGQDISLGYQSDTWYYGQGGWRHHFLNEQPPGRVLGSIVYDRSRSRAVLFGGVDANTWELLPAAAPSWTRDGAGCAGSAAAPSLDTAPGSLPALGSTCTLQLTALPGPAVLLFGVDLVRWNGQPLPVDLDPARPTCQLWLAPLPGVGALLLPTAGTASFGITLPAIPALGGIVFGTQAFVLDPTTTGGFVLSNAGVLRGY